MYLTKKEFTQHRVGTVRRDVNLYDLMDKDGHPPRMRERSAQIPCCFMSDHSKGVDTKPSARFYPRGERSDHDTYYCWVCTPRPLDVIGYIQRSKGLNFFQALRTLEHMYGIRYEGVEVAKDLVSELAEMSALSRGADLQSELKSCERRLRRVKESVTMSEYADLGFILDRGHYLFSKGAEKKAQKLLTVWKHQVSSRVSSSEETLELSQEL